MRIAAFSSIFVFFTLLHPMLSAEPAPPLHALIVSDAPEVAPATVTAYSDLLAAAGYTVEPAGMDALTKSERLDPATLDMLFLPNAGALPEDSIGPIGAYLKGGGDIVALGAPLWRTRLHFENGSWISYESKRQTCDMTLLDHPFFDFAGPLDGWSRNSDNGATPAIQETVPVSGQPFTRALHFAPSKVGGWECLVSPKGLPFFQPGETLTVFFAKGGPRTTELAIEWGETDGSRWIATVPLTTEWRSYILAPEQFHYWESVPERATTVFQPANASYISFGIARSHVAVVGDAHEFWIGPAGGAKPGPQHACFADPAPAPALELLSPAYKFHACDSVTEMSAPSGLGSGQRMPLPLAADLYAMHPRPDAGGFDKGRAWRYAPLVEATANGAWRGAPGALLVHAEGDCAGGVWAAYAVRDLAWYAQPETQAAIGAVVQAMARGLFLLDAGSNFFTYFENQPAVLGARVINTGKTPRDARIETQLAVQNGAPAKSAWDVHMDPGQIVRVEEPHAVPDGDAKAVANLLLDGAVIDAAENEVHVWRPSPTPSFITAQNGDFTLDGNRWRAHGVNYMPSSGIATEDGNYFENWLGARSYDPKIVARDLDHIVDLGLNAVSIFLYHHAIPAQNLLDLLRQLDARGLKANLSLRPGTPLDFEWDKMREILQYYRIAEQDCVFALDLAWEPMFGSQQDRARYDAQWRAWIDERYGNVENAEASWGCAAPRDAAGLPTALPGAMLRDDGPWQRMSAAYRRFLETLLYEYYSKARALVRSVDPNHLVSFRMTEAGDPTFQWDKVVPYDWQYLSAAVDLLEPEAYGRIGDWEKVKPGLFEHEYARAVAPELPMMWAEAGVSVWVATNNGPTEERQQFAAAYYRDLYRMFTESGCDGVFFWWYPGGYRTGERSDYGILEPDGSDRPVTKVIRECGRDFLDGPDAPAPDLFLDMDRDAHPCGVAGIYKDTQEAFWAARATGKTPGLRSTGAGTTSADCPLEAVGNAPYDGHQPLKYLDGYFDTVEIQTPEGWNPVEKGGTMAVSPGAPVLARIAATNLAEATWLGGGVFLCIERNGETVRVPLAATTPSRHQAHFDAVELAPKDTPLPATVTLTFEAEGRATFGPRYAITLGASTIP